MTAWDLSCVHSSWLTLLSTVLSKNERLERIISDARSKTTVYPPKDLVFASLSLPLDKVKVVILGQDPYHGPGQAVGLSFAVGHACKEPPSLRNIMKEVADDLGKPCSSLLEWPDQGILLLNTLLTVESGKPMSHANIGWESVTDAIIMELAKKGRGIVWMLWGKEAQKKKALLQGCHIIESAHPSPLSAYRGFFGSKQFSKANALLDVAIQWNYAEKDK